MGKGWECASAAALLATVLPMTPTCEKSQKKTVGEEIGEW